jgi:peptidoglycan hydrolase CwlO-like protein
MIRDTCTRHWNSIGKSYRWLTGIASGVATLIAAYFAVAGFSDTIDTWVVTEAEAAELQQQQLKVLDEYRLSLEDERRQRQIDDLQNEINDIGRQIRYLNKRGDRTSDEDLELEELQDYRWDLQKRLRTLRCIASGTDPNECGV